MADLPHVRTNLGDVRPHTRRVAEEIAQRWTIHYMWGIGGSGHHAAGRALDIMTLTASQGSLRTRMGNEIAAYLQDNAGRLGILYIIWRQRIWNHSFASDRQHRPSWREWRRMEDRGSPTENHMDHVHVSFDANPRSYRPPEDDMPSVDDLLHTRAIKRVRPDGSKTDEEISLAEYVQEIYEAAMEDRTTRHERENRFMDEVLARLQRVEQVLTKENPS